LRLWVKKTALVSRWKGFRAIPFAWERETSAVKIERLIHLSNGIGGAPPP